MRCAFQRRWRSGERCGPRLSLHQDRLCQLSAARHCGSERGARRAGVHDVALLRQPQRLGDGLQDEGSPRRGGCALEQHRAASQRRRRARGRRQRSEDFLRPHCLTRRPLVIVRQVDATADLLERRRGLHLVGSDLRPNRDRSDSTSDALLILDQSAHRAFTGKPRSGVHLKAQFTPIISRLQTERTQSVHGRNQNCHVGPKKSSAILTAMK